MGSWRGREHNAANAEGKTQMINRSWGINAAILPGLLAALVVPPPAAAAASCPGYSACPAVDYPSLIASDTQITAYLATIDSIKAASVAALKGAGLTQPQKLALLGQAMVFDKTLSAAGNEACALCHMPASGFADGITSFAPAGGIFPGTVLTRTGNRTPLSLAYASYAPPLFLRPNPRGGQDLIGGNFWDDRATGAITGTPAGDQAMAPLTNPLEMALPDQACALRRIAKSPYAASFRAAWGKASLAIVWPANVDTLCAKPAGSAAALSLSTAARAQVAKTMADIGITIATYEASTLASPFTSKFDAVQAGTASFTTSEADGAQLFNGAAHCNACHALNPGPAGKPLFTDFSAENDGVPANPALPYLHENTADSSGFIANAAGTTYVDQGVGGYLASSANTNASWKALAPQFIGTFQVPSLRNIAALPANGAVRTYMHNGVFHSLATVVHFYNTRDVLPRCTGSTGIGVTCWPAPEEPVNVSRRIGRLGLTPAQEADIVAFLGTLTDGYTAPKN